MKYLKLDARDCECHGLARALVGSHGAYDGYTQKLLAVHDDYFLIEYQTVVGDFWKVKEICLTLDTIKLCPYVAMREGVKLKSTINSWGGIIHKISVDDNGLNEFIHMTSSYTIHSRSDITLDLANLPKGAEVVEL